MKRLLISLVGFCILLHMHAQETPKASPAPPKPKKFTIGISYFYFQSDLKLTKLSLSSVWQGVDFGTNTLTKDEISNINSYSSFQSKSNAVCLQAGMVFLGKPGGKWHIDGNLIVGIAGTYYKNHNKAGNKDEFIVNSEFKRPCLGLGFNFRYNLDQQWGIALRPSVTYSWGTSSKISGTLYQENPFLNESKKMKSSSFLSKIVLAACYSYKSLAISAGPGFYYLFNKRELHVESVNPENGSTYSDDINSELCSKNFLEGNLTIQWMVIKCMSIQATAGIGADYFVDAGISYHL